MQAELGDKAVTGVVSMAVSDDGSETHFEAFQVRANTPATCCGLRGSTGPHCGLTSIWSVNAPVERAGLAKAQLPQL